MLQVSSVQIQQAFLISFELPFCAIDLQCLGCGAKWAALLLLKVPRKNVDREMSNGEFSRLFHRSVRSCFL